MTATFELKTNDDSQYYFDFVDTSGELLLLSGEYSTRQDAEEAISNVRLGSLVSEHIAAGQVASGDSFFVIKDQSGDVLVKSILFSSRMLFDNALHTVKDNACVADIVDMT